MLSLSRPMMLAACLALLLGPGLTALASPPLAQGTAKPKADDRTPLADLYGDPLPPGAVARLGTVRLRHREFLDAVAFSADGKQLLSADCEGCVRVWDAATGRLLRERRLSRKPGCRVEFFAAGKIAVTHGYASEPCCVWDLTSGKQVLRSRGKGSNRSAAVSQDGKRAAERIDDSGTVSVQDLATGAELHRLEGPGRPFDRLSFSPDGSLLAAASHTKVVLWDLTKGRQRCQVEGPAISLAFSPDGKALAVGADPDVRLFDTGAGNQLFHLKGEKGRIDTLAFAADGQTLAAGSIDGSIRLWDPRSGKLLQTIREHMSVSCVALSPDGKTVASGAMNGLHAVRLWDARTGKELGPPQAHKTPIRSVAVSSDGKLVASCTHLRGEPTLRLWDPATGKQLTELRGEGGGVLCVRFSVDGKWLAAAGGDGATRLWDVASGKQFRALHAPPARGVMSVAFSPDGKTLAAGDGYSVEGKLMGRLVLWDVATGGHRVVRDGEDFVWEVAYSPDGKLLASVGQAAHLWDGHTGRLRATLSDPTKRMYRVGFTPDGRFVAFGDGRGVISVREVVTGKEVLPLRCESPSSLGYLAFAPDGRTLAALGPARGILLWDLATGKEIARFSGHDQTAYCLAFTPDGRRLVSGGDDTTLLVWDVATPLRKRPALVVKEFAPEQGEKQWGDLAAKDAPTAYRAMWALVAASEHAVRLLQKRLPPAKPVDTQGFAALVRDLDSKEFSVRRKASAALEEAGAAAEAALRAAVAGRPSLEVRQRVQRLLEKLESTPLPADQVRIVRAVAVLEWIGTQPAREVLASLARGEAEARLTEEAKASLDRLTKRPTAP